MKHFRLKFNYGVEIGAFLAYSGHYQRTKDSRIYDISMEEVVHRGALSDILRDFGEVPNERINQIFRFIGWIIFRLCKYSPIFLLNWVAISMELFAVFSYKSLAKVYPQYEEKLLEMANAEEQHKLYFQINRRKYE